MEVATTVHITFNAAENQSGRVGRPAKGTFTLKPRAAAALALTTLIVAPVGGAKTLLGAPLKEERADEWTFRRRLLRLVAVQRAISCVSSLTVALVGGGSVDAGGKRVAVVEAQPAFFHIRAGGVGPDCILVFII